MELFFNQISFKPYIVGIFIALFVFSCGQKATKNVTAEKATNTTTPKVQPSVDAAGNTVPKKKSTTVVKKKNASKSSFNIAFGSCNKHDEPQPLWNPILKNKPDLWIWTGDIIYGDTKNMELMQSKYDAQKKNPSYQKILDYCPVIGVWDDHDFGQNDGGKKYTMKKESKDLLMSFLDVPEDAEVMKHDGVYTSYTYGEKDKMIKVILLDCRTFKDDIKRTNKISIADPNADLLGATQWAWFENELRQSKASVNIIVSSIQVIPEEHRFEKWANHPTDRARLFELLKKTKPKNTVLVSGDRHIGELSKIDLEGFGTLVEITSSGLTHAYTSFTSEDNKHRIGKPQPVLNFGVINIDWNAYSPILKMELRGEDNKQLQMFRMAIKK